jgi:hypothetical protein
LFTPLNLLRHPNGIEVTGGDGERLDIRSGLHSRNGEKAGPGRRMGWKRSKPGT